MSGWAPGPAWLFVPADRPDRFAKALKRADVAILDLEDAVAPDRKQAARDALAAYDWPDRSGRWCESIRDPALSMRRISPSWPGLARSA